MSINLLEKRISHIRIAWLVIFCFVFLSLSTLSYAGGGRVPAEEADRNSESAEYKPTGLLPLTNQLPFYMIFLNPLPQMPNIEEEGKLGFDFTYSVANVNVKQSSTYPRVDDDRIEMDMEIQKLNLLFTYGLSDRFDIQLDIPYLVMSGGYLDGTVEFFEDFLGVQTPKSRADWDRNKYKYYFKYGDDVLIDRSDGEDGFGDIVLSTKYKLAEENGRIPAIALRGNLKLPSGSHNKLLGSGEVDFGFGVLAQKNLGRVWMHLNSDIIFIEKPDVLKPIDMDGYIFSTMIAAEYFFNNKFSLILQGGFSTTPFPTDEFKGATSVENVPAYAGMGVNYKINEKSNFKFSVTENCSSAFPDITLQTSLKVKF